MRRSFDSLTLAQDDRLERCYEPSGEGGNDTQRTKHENVAGHAGRDGRPVPYEMFLSAYLVDGTLPSGEGGNDTQGTLHELSVGTADPSGEGGNDNIRTLHE